MFLDVALLPSCGADLCLNTSFPFHISIDTSCSLYSSRPLHQKMDSNEVSDSHSMSMKKTIFWISLKHPSVSTRLRATTSQKIVIFEADRVQHNVQV